MPFEFAVKMQRLHYRLLEGTFKPCWLFYIVKNCTLVLFVALESEQLTTLNKKLRINSTYCFSPFCRYTGDVWVCWQVLKCWLNHVQIPLETSQPANRSFSYLNWFSQCDLQCTFWFLCCLLDMFGCVGRV